MSQKELAKPQFLITNIYPLEKEITNSVDHFCSFNLELCVRHVTGNDEDYLRKIPRVVVQKSALSKGPL
jgi:hypothetical protein